MGERGVMGGWAGRWALLVALLLGATACAPDTEGAPRAEDLGDPAAEAWEGDPSEVLASRRPVGGTEQDWAIAKDRVDWIHQTGLDSLDYFGDILGAVGERFVGTPYEAHTLQVPGEERLVINLEGLDCVTFVENVLALARIARSMEPGADMDAFQQAYRQELTDIRYRSGSIDGYPSRLHYFTEWIHDNDRMGLVEDLSRQLGGVADPEPIDFMSTHPDAYDQLADPAVLQLIVRMEARLGRVERFYIPQDEIEAKANLIRNGDIIAATSTVGGLDVAHTGLALWRGGTLRLLHAPLAGGVVSLSEEPLADRIKSISGQDGIMVARPVDPGHWRTDP